MCTTAEINIQSSKECSRDYLFPCMLIYNQYGRMKSLMSDIGVCLTLVRQ